MNDTAHFGVDIGGTKTAVGVVSAAGEIIERVTLPTPKESAEALVAAIAGAIAVLSERHRASGVGVAVAALVDRRHALLPFATHLPVRATPFQTMLEQSTGHAINVDNDATAAMWAEWQLGAARGSDECLMVSVGTGVGGGAVSGGALQRGFNGMAGEIGHLRFVPDGLPCPCGLQGCWEQYASGRTLDRWAREQLAAGTPMARLLIAEAGEAEQVSGKTVSRLAAAGVPEAVECLRDLGRNLGIGMASLASVLDPELIVVGGGLVETGELLLAPARQALAEHLFGAQHRDVPDIVPAELGPDAALIGAAGLAPA